MRKKDVTHLEIEQAYEISSEETKELIQQLDNFTPQEDKEIIKVLEQ